MEHRWWSRPPSERANLHGGSLQGKLLDVDLGAFGHGPSGLNFRSILGYLTAEQLQVVVVTEITMTACSIRVSRPNVI